MADKKQTASSAQTDRKPRSETPKPANGGRQAQIDEARDEGAGKASVPVEDVTTANDE